MERAVLAQALIGDRLEQRAGHGAVEANAEIEIEMVVVAPRGAREQRWRGRHHQTVEQYGRRELPDEAVRPGNYIDRAEPRLVAEGRHRKGVEDALPIVRARCELSEGGKNYATAPPRQGGRQAPVRLGPGGGAEVDIERDVFRARRE